MSDLNTLKELVKKPDIRRFVDIELDFLQNNIIAPCDIPVILKITRCYKNLLIDKIEILLGSLQSKKCKTIIDELLLLFMKYEFNIDRKSTATLLTQKFSEFVCKSNYEIFDIFTEEEYINFFSDYREDDIFHRLVKWYKHVQINEEFMFCDECGSMLVPSFKWIDNYICSNDKCSAKQEIYHNYCWKCLAEINSYYNDQCENCKWYICNKCGSCSKGGICTETKPKHKKIKKIAEFNDHNDNEYLEVVYKKAIYNFLKIRKNRININNTNRGRKVIDNENDLDLYTAAYLRHHKVKLISAFTKIDFYTNDNYFNVYDWGCGQGIGTIALLEKLKTSYPGTKVKDVYLIEPSKKALTRAVGHVSKSKRINNIIAVNKDFNELNNSLFSKNIDNSIHIFSNILDVDFDLDRFSNFVKSIHGKRSIYICVSPNYPKAKERISIFSNNFKTEKGYKLINQESTSIRTQLYDIYKNKYVDKLVKRYEITFETNN